MKMQKLINLMSISLTLFVAACNGGSAAQAPQAVLTAYPPQFATSMQQGVFSPSGDPLFDSLNKYEIVTNTGNKSEGYYLEVYGYESAGESSSWPSNINGGQLKLNESNCLNVDFKNSQFKLSNCRGQLKSGGYTLTADYYFYTQGRSEVRLAKGRFNLNVPRSDFIDQKTVKLSFINNLDNGRELRDDSSPIVENWRGQGALLQPGGFHQYQVEVRQDASSDANRFFICAYNLEVVNGGKWMGFSFSDVVVFSAFTKQRTVASIMNQPLPFFTGKYSGANQHDGDCTADTNFNNHSPDHPISIISGISWLRRCLSHDTTSSSFAAKGLIRDNYCN